MRRYLVILGRKNELAFFELQTVLQRNALQIRDLTFERIGEAVILNAPWELDLINLMKILGGTVKIAVLGKKATRTDFMEKVVAILRNEAIGKSKLVFGISLIRSPNPNQRLLIPKALKERLSNEGVASRYVLPAKNDQLTSAQVSLGGVTELYLLWTESGIEIAKTVVVQDFAGFAKRDYKRPYIDPRGGMLPPKIASQMVNLAFPSWPKRGAWILDPFCGTGTIAMEAMMLRIGSVSSDHSAEKVAGTRQNLEWLSKEEELNTHWQVIKADATKVSQLLDRKVDAIVTEPFLGSPTPSLAKLRNTIKGLNKLYLGALKNWRSCLKKAGRLVIAVPEIRVAGVSEQADLVIDRRENLGYTLVAGPLDYEREGAVVRRLIYVLQKE